MSDSGSAPQADPPANRHADDRSCPSEQGKTCQGIVWHCSDLSKCLSICIYTLLAYRIMHIMRYPPNHRLRSECQMRVPDPGKAGSECQMRVQTPGNPDKTNPDKTCFPRRSCGGIVEYRGSKTYICNELSTPQLRRDCRVQRFKKTRIYDEELKRTCLNNRI